MKVCRKPVSGPRMIAGERPNLETTRTSCCADFRFPGVRRTTGDLHRLHVRRSNLEIDISLELPGKDRGRRGSVVVGVAPLHAHPVELLVAGLDCWRHRNRSVGGHAALPATIPVLQTVRGRIRSARTLSRSRRHAMGFHRRAYSRGRISGAADGRIVLARFSLAIHSFSRFQKGCYRRMGMGAVTWRRRGVQPGPWQLVADIDSLGADDRRTSGEDPESGSVHRGSRHDESSISDMGGEYSSVVFLVIRKGLREKTPAV